MQSINCLGYCRGKGKLKDEWDSGQNSDRIFPSIEFSNFKFGFVIANYLLSYPSIIW